MDIIHLAFNQLSIHAYRISKFRKLREQRVNDAESWLRRAEEENMRDVTWKAYLELRELVVRLLAERDGALCAICKASLERATDDSAAAPAWDGVRQGKNPETVIDFAVPLAEGGACSADNARLVHRYCRTLRKRMGVKLASGEAFTCQWCESTVFGECQVASPYGKFCTRKCAQSAAEFLRDRPLDDPMWLRFTPPQRMQSEISPSSETAPPSGSAGPGDGEKSAPPS